MMVRFPLALSVLALAAGAAFAEPPKPGVGVMHWWVSAGEAAAIGEIKTAFEARGGRWIDRPHSSYGSVRKAAIEQIAAGYPPAAMQWLAGPDLEAMTDFELVAETEPLAQRDGWHKTMYPFVPVLAGRGGKFVAVPVSIHGENWAWYSRSVYAELGLDFPQSWDELLQQAPAIRAAGYTPLALGDEDWQLRILFTSVLLGVAGPEAYDAIVLGENPDALHEPAARAAFEVFLRLRGLVDPGHVGRPWNDATAMVARGEAAVQFMGDWAKGEFTAAGLSPDVDFECRLAPAATPAYVTVVDLFLLGRTEDPAIAEAQELFARTVVSPEVQVAFALRKGSTPVLRDLGPVAQQLDVCAARAVATLAQPETFLPTVNLIDDGVYVARLSSAIKAVWTDAQIDVDGAIAHLSEALVIRD